MAKTTGTRSTGRSAPRPAPRAEEGFGAWAMGWVRAILGAVVLFLVIRTFLVQTFRIISGSMIPTLLVGDWVMISKLAYGPQIPGTHVHLPGYTHPQRGQVVVFHSPLEDIDVVKRIIGVAGDTLSMQGGKIVRNGKLAAEPFAIHTDSAGIASSTRLDTLGEAGAQVARERAMMREHQLPLLAPAANPAVYSPTRDDWGPIVVPAGHVWVMGDNRDDSFDSRYWGALDTERLEGNVLFIYYAYDADSTKPLPFLTDVRWGRIGKGVH